MRQAQADQVRGVGKDAGPDVMMGQMRLPAPGVIHLVEPEQRRAARCACACPQHHRIEMGRVLVEAQPCLSGPIEIGKRLRADGKRWPGNRPGPQPFGQLCDRARPRGGCSLP